MTFDKDTPLTEAQKQGLRKHEESQRKLREEVEREWLEKQRLKREKSNRKRNQ